MLSLAAPATPALSSLGSNPPRVRASCFSATGFPASASRPALCAVPTADRSAESAESYDESADEPREAFQRDSAPRAHAELDAELRQGLGVLWPELRHRALRLTRSSSAADDLVQDTIERALRFAHTFREGSHLRAWLMRIMQNLFVSQCRRHAIERRVLESACMDPNGWTRAESTKLLPGLSPPVERALDDLPVPLREVVDLVDLRHYSYRDAAEVQGVPVGTVMSRLHRGRARLKLVLDEPDATAA